MVLCDFHLHSKYSFDSEQEMEPVCKKAIELGISRICFTDHVEFAVPDSPWPDFSSRQKEIDYLNDKYIGKLRVLGGVEIGQGYKDKNACVSMLRDNVFDFVIASVHTLAGGIQPSKYKFSCENYMASFNEYFEDLNKLVEETEYDAVGHITFPFRYVPDELLDIYPIKIWKNNFLNIFRTLVKRNKIIEINTSGYRTKLKDAMPSLEVLEWYRECGGTMVCIGSDGHSESSAFKNIRDGYELARKAGLDVVRL